MRSTCPNWAVMSALHDMKKLKRSSRKPLKVSSGYLTPVYIRKVSLLSLLVSTTNWSAASQETPRISRNPKVHYRTHKRPPLSLSWPSPIQSIYPHPAFWRSILILSTHLRLGLPSGFLPSGFPTKTLYTDVSSSHTRYMPRPSHGTILSHFNNTLYTYLETT